MILETRLPTPADIIRVPHDHVIHSAKSQFAMQSAFPSSMLTEDMDTSSSSGIGTSTVVWIFIGAGLGVTVMMVYLHYKRKKKLQNEN